jgi:hypothetical protein
MRAELITPIAAPPADWARRATTSGKTGATHRTCRKRRAPNGHTERATASATTHSEEAARRPGMRRLSGTTSPRREASMEPSAAATPEAKMMSPPTSSVRSVGTPSGGRICGRIDVRKNTCAEPPRTITETTRTSRQRAGLDDVCRRPGSPSSPMPHRTSAPQPKRMTAPTTNDSRKPSRAAAMAPASGPMTCPTVIADCTATTWRRTSAGSALRPALTNAKVDEAPMKPSTRRTAKSSGKVRATAMPRKARPWRVCAST